MGWLWYSEEKTNNKHNSIKELKLRTIKFKELWNNYPDTNPKHISNESNGQDIFNDHCAINISETLLKIGLQMRSFKGAKCYGKCNYPKMHVLRAQELANWLTKKPFPGILEPEIYTGKNFEEHIGNKTGIIFFQDYWVRPGEKNGIRTGDHIDLWNKGELASMNPISSWARLNFPSIGELFGLSDLRHAKKVLFWRIE
ncbi:type VI secretion system amidase effector protein Tae4 [Avibacterium avium]|uniref:type VI secretion system amidase effector protein Tae4 n=1 Tax=Avibacterium TaxID=292486 RepID=UPI0020261395|nr:MULTISPECIES: type VI secretion system amidase effector protein Tae4 [unclassified Avibacterium]MCW9734072.1 type VI secretion system amidase effector protein Tae4 [Avibacterium sp. 20-15]URL01357.1 type VI secretion system amidase effector protein Tae4 [Avibacterium sp. 20-126]URL03719.1 type VI secretion system amidase effector protein Tae4 [Avibacterium sp. 20-132]